LRIFADFYPQFFWAKNHLLSPYFLEKTQKNYSESRLITLNKNFPCPSTLHPFLFLKKLPNEPISKFQKYPSILAFFKLRLASTKKTNPFYPTEKPHLPQLETQNPKPETRSPLVFSVSSNSSPIKFLPHGI